MKYKKESNGNRIYTIENSCVFKKNDGEFGGLSNMASIFPLEINRIGVKSSEALYQACKFPDNCDLQKKIISANSPFAAKMFSKGQRTRDDWFEVRIEVMRWCLRVKLAQNYYSFGDLLKTTKENNIVEYSDKDTFWGAEKINENELKGKNALGRLLMELRRDFYLNKIEEMLIVKPPKILNFKLCGENIEAIDMNFKYIEKY